MGKISKKYRYLAVLLIVTSVAIFSLPVKAQTSSSSKSQSMDPVSVVDEVLCSMGLGGCPQTDDSAKSQTDPSAQSTVTPVSGSGTSRSSGGFFGLGGSRKDSGQAILYGSAVPKLFTNNEITLVRVARSDSVPGALRPDEQVYEIIGGKKHLIPNLDIFFDYGFNPQQVQFITQEQLDKYSRINLVQVAGDKNKTVYYITENGLIRPVLNQEVLKSYGGRAEDAITISKKEFNFYPENKYIYLERPYSGDIYLISGDTKRYLTPMAVKRLEINSIQIAPVNELEFNAYKIGEPVVF